MNTSFVNEVLLNNSYNVLNSTKKSNVEDATTITPFKRELQVRMAKVSRTSKEDKSQTSSLKDVFRNAADKYDISYDFLTAVAKAESDFNPKCVSSAGAKGIMQLMPNEIKEFKVKDPFDYEENIMAAAKLLKAHLKKFDGNYTLAAAAYNAGSGAVKKYGGVPPYSETQNYVKKINKFMKEGVKVPNVKVKSHDTYEGGGGYSPQKVDNSKAEDATKNVSKTKTEGNTNKFDEGVKATQKDYDAITVTVGTGDSAITMTYGAYLQYLKLGTTGVG